MVLCFNGMYGLSMVVVHALLLGDMPEVGEIPYHTDPPSRSGNRYLSDASPDALGEDIHHEWLLQLMDLDIGWSHELLGFDDESCLIGGLIYGVIVTLSCGYMFHAVLTGGSYLPMTSRWFVAFFNLEIVLFVGLALAKLPKLCKIQDKFLPRLEMNCNVLRFLYLQRVAIMTLVAGFGCWVFSSLAYFLAFGFQAIDRPEYADHLEMHDNQADAQQGRSAPQMGMMGGTPSHTQLQSFNRSPVGEAVNVGPRSSFAQRGARSLGGSAMSTRMPPGPYAGGGGGGRTSYNIPRASSSMTTATSQAETQALIKPPVAVF